MFKGASQVNLHSEIFGKRLQARGSQYVLGCCSGSGVVVVLTTQSKQGLMGLFFFFLWQHRKDVKVSCTHSMQ